MAAPVPKEPVRFVTLPSNKKLRYRVCGPDLAKHKVVFVMGFLVPLEGWNEIQYLLSTNFSGYQSVVLDNCGSGLSSKPNILFHSVRSMAQDVWDLVGSLGWENVHVVSVSMGGMIALEMTTQHPEKIQSLTLINTHSGGIGNIVPPLWGLYNFVRPMLNSSSKVRIECALNTLFGSPVLTSPELKKKYTDRIVDSWKTRPQPYFSGLLAQLGATSSHYVSKKRLEHVAGTGLPVCIFVGKQDILISPQNSQYLSSIFSAKLHEFEDCGHGLHIQEAEKFLKSLVEHIEDSYSRERQKVTKPAPSHIVEHAMMRLFHFMTWAVIICGIRLLLKLIF